MTVSALLAAALPAVVSLTNSFVTLDIDGAGRIASIRERATGRELLERVRPGVLAVGEDGREIAPVAFVRRGGHLVWRFEKGAAAYAVKPFGGGWRFTLERANVPGAAGYMTRLFPKSRRYLGWRANILSDDESAVSLRVYGLKSDMRVTSAFVAATVRPGESFGLAAGPRKDFLGMMRAMTVDSGAPHNPGGGAWSIGSDICRKSYLHAIAPSAENIDAFIQVCERGGFGTLHLREGWYDKFGHYEVNRKAFPGGKSDLKKAVDKIHAAGLSACMHTLTACIDLNDPWLRTDDVTNLLDWCAYTLAAPFAADAKEVTVAEPPDARHDIVFTYSGNGNAIRIGREIVQYTGVRRERPYGFTGLKRGAFGTPVSAHAAGERAHYLQQRYLAFYPNPDSPLLGKVADAIANVFETCGFEQIYCDGAEGMMSDYGVHCARRAIAERIGRDGRGISNEGAHGSTAHSWWFHSRVGNLDVAHWDPKRFHDLHLDGAIEGARKANFLEPQTGWWSFKLTAFHSRTYYLDETEYYAGKNVAWDACTSVVAGEQLTSHPAKFHAQRMLTVFGWYEHARLARAFTPEAIAALREPRSEFRLRQSAADGRWYLTRVAPPGVKRVEAKYGGGPWDGPRRRTILSARDLPQVVITNTPGVTSRLVATEGEHGASLSFSARNSGKKSRGACAWARRAFAGPDYFNGAVATGPTNVTAAVWIKGDGSGALLNLQFENPRELGRAWQEHYVDLDFTGWRYFEFPFCQSDAGRWSDYKWPYNAGWVSMFHSPVFRVKIAAVSLFLNEIPAGGKADVEVSEVRIVPIASRTLPAGVQPFDLVSGEFAELENGYWTRYDKDGDPMERKPAASDASLAIGAPIPAFTDEGARRIRYEAMEPQVFDPAHGFDTLAPVVVRPGEKARVEVQVYGAPPGFSLTIGGVTRTDGGDFGVFAGVNPVSAKGAGNGRVRIEIVKRYTDEPVQYYVGDPQTWAVEDAGISNFYGRVKGVEPIWIEGEPLAGNPTRVFAWWGLPKGASAASKVPAMVLVHGGGGTAYAKWVETWNDRGYAAIAMDTCGNAPRGERGGKPHPEHEWSGPSGWGSSFAQVGRPLKDQWTYHAIAAIMRAHSFIRGSPEVDAERTGITGISWGGYLTSIAMCVDRRFKFAAPVYGCGFYELNPEC